MPYMLKIDAKLHFMKGELESGLSYMETDFIYKLKST